MIYIAHRINNLEILKKIPIGIGVEFDVRDYKKNLVLSHDPFSNGLSLERFIEKVGDRFLIINIKSEGIESKILKILKENKITKYFFLDSTIPQISRYINSSKTMQFALRFSNYENIYYNLKNNQKWLWVDTFNSFKLNFKKLRSYYNKGYKLCLVSPELHKKKINEKNIKFFFQICKKNKVKFHAICDKYYNFKKWENCIK